jgi:hypothetical protein
MGTPDVPDYAALAKAQSEASRFNQATPYGMSYWNGNTQFQQLSPDQQNILDQQEQYSQGVGQKINQGLYSVGNFGIDQSKLPQMDTQAGDTVYQSYMNRLQPQMAQQNESFEQQMANQGIAPGTQAYDNAKRNLMQGQNDLMLQGASNAATAQNNVYNTALGGQVTIGNQPINQLNALRNGLTLNNPTYQNTGSAPNLTGAAQAQFSGQQGLYNVDQANQNNLYNGLFSLGSAYLSS